MNGEFSVNGTDFVLHGPPDVTLDAVRPIMQEWGTVEVVTANPGYFVLRLNRPTDDPKGTWGQLRKALSQLQGEWQILPVMIDSEGNKRYPLGTIAVRFKEPLSKQQMDDFSKTKGLLVAKQNKYVPTQFSFEPSDIEAFLPDLLDEIGMDHSTLVWPEMFAAFRRE